MPFLSDVYADCIKQIELSFSLKVTEYDYESRHMETERQFKTVFHA